MKLTGHLIDSFEVNPMKNISVVRRSLAGLGLLILILDGGTAIEGVRTGINICIRTLIPSLFPFMVLCGLINGNSETLYFGGLQNHCRW